MEEAGAVMHGVHAVHVHDRKIKGAQHAYHTDHEHIVPLTLHGDTLSGTLPVDARPPGKHSQLHGVLKVHDCELWELGAKVRVCHNLSDYYLRIKNHVILQGAVYRQEQINSEVELLTLDESDEAEHDVITQVLEALDDDNDTTYTLCKGVKERFKKLFAAVKRFKDDVIKIDLTALFAKNKKGDAGACLLHDLMELEFQVGNPDSSAPFTFSVNNGSMMLSAKRSEFQHIADKVGQSCNRLTPNESEEDITGHTIEVKIAGKGSRTVNVATLEEQAMQQFSMASMHAALSSVMKKYGDHADFGETVPITVTSHCNMPLGRHKYVLKLKADVSVTHWNH